MKTVGFAPILFAAVSAAACAPQLPRAGEQGGATGGTVATGTLFEIGRTMQFGPGSRYAAESDRESTLDVAQVCQGVLVAWEDSRFQASAALAGLWRPREALREYGAGVFFFEPYDPARVPVVFVHGINGTAGDLKAVIDRIDRSRFQAWVFQYPSGLRLHSVGNALVQVLDNLQAHYGFDRYALVAHSMGGLISRVAVNKIALRGDPQPIALFVTISTPWEGHIAAELGAKLSPYVLPVWLDMSPGSPFLGSLLSKPLPDTLPYYLFFGYQGLFGNDGTASLGSMLSRAAQDQSRRVIGFPTTHSGVLTNPEVIDALNALLAQHAAPSASMSVRRSPP
jgi:pimeloyl-ACP methyl ester carboxylesterase